MLRKKRVDLTKQNRINSGELNEEQIKKLSEIITPELEKIKRSSIDLAELALTSILSYKNELTEETKNKLSKEVEIYDAVIFVRKILLHPAPQNNQKTLVTRFLDQYRLEQDKANSGTHEKNIAVKQIKAKLNQGGDEKIPGLFNLKSLDTTNIATKDAVVNYIIDEVNKTKNIYERINKTNNNPGSDDKSSDQQRTTLLAQYALNRRNRPVKQATYRIGDANETPAITPQKAKK